MIQGLLQTNFGIIDIVEDSFKNLIHAKKEKNRIQKELREKYKDRESETSEEDQQLYTNASQAVIKFSVINIVFSIMFLDHFIYEYALFNLGQKYYFDHLDNLSLHSKWALIPKINLGKEINTKSKYYNNLIEMIKIRNRIVHDKGKPFTINLDFEKAINKAFNEHKTIEKIARSSLKTIKGLLNELLLIDKTDDLKEKIDELEIL